MALSIGGARVSDRFITFDQALAHLRLTIVPTSPPSPDEADLRLKMLQAEEIILDYLKLPASSPLPWSDDTDVPPLVQAAMLLQLGELYRFRGDDVSNDGPWHDDGQLSPQITNILRRFRDPALA